MLSYISNLIDLKVAIASLSGAMVYILSQHHFDRARQPSVFFVSFILGITEADTTLAIAKCFIPASFTGERTIGAFLCSALVVTVTMKILSFIESKTSGSILKTGM